MLLKGNDGSDFVILSLDGGQHLLWGPEGLESLGKTPMIPKVCLYH